MDTAVSMRYRTSVQTHHQTLHREKHGFMKYSQPVYSVILSVCQAPSNLSFCQLVNPPSTCHFVTVCHFVNHPSICHFVITCHFVSLPVIFRFRARARLQRGTSLTNLSPLLQPQKIPPARELFEADHIKGQRSAAQRSAAQRSAAQRSAAQRSAAQRSAAAIPTA